MKPQIRYNLTFEKYAKRPGINASAIVAGRKSMLHMREAMTGQDKTETPAMRRGRLDHAAILEPDVFFTRVHIFKGEKRGTAWTDFKQEHGTDWILTQHELCELTHLSNAVHANQTAHRLISKTRHEVSLFWEHPLYGRGKARLDGLDKQNGIFDLKTTAEIDPRSFARTAFRLGYHIRLGWYDEATGMVKEWSGLSVHLICVEQQRPFDCVVYEVPPGLIEQGRSEAVEIAKQYHASEYTQSWPGVCSEVMPLELPEWAQGPVELTVNGETVEV